MPLQESLCILKAAYKKIRYLQSQNIPIPAPSFCQDRVIVELLLHSSTIVISGTNQRYAILSKANV